MLPFSIVCHCHLQVDISCLTSGTLCLTACTSSTPAGISCLIACACCLTSGLTSIHLSPPAGAAFSSETEGQRTFYSGRSGGKGDKSRWHSRNDSSSEESRGSRGLPPDGGRSGGRGDKSRWRSRDDLSPDGSREPRGSQGLPPDAANRRRHRPGQSLALLSSFTLSE